jgi:hypothetical protein
MISLSFALIARVGGKMTKTPHIHKPFRRCRLPAGEPTTIGRLRQPGRAVDEGTFIRTWRQG